MVYPYACEKCDKTFDVVKHHTKSSRKEKCPDCGKVASRIWTRAEFIGTKVENAEFNHGLGMVTKSARHRKDEARARGLEEVGNEAPKKTREHFEKVREDRRRKIYDEVS